MDHLNMNVRNLEESVAFYRELFGFTVRKDQPDYTSAIIGNDWIKLCLYESPDEVTDGGINHFGFHVENFEAIQDRCKEMGVPLNYGVVEWPGSRSIYISDPNGYEIELSEVAGGGL
jgi:catechol 2,3-dioxygenase-like lactoylglutathione lyase family enzyme